MGTFDTALAIVLEQYHERLGQAENKRRALKAEGAVRQQAAKQHSSWLAVWLAWIATMNTAIIIR